jgi:RNA polymerase sigma-70 factor (ECF subfamily)
MQTAPNTLDDLEVHRRELIGYCYRMLGSSFEAEDAVQETFVRAWRNLDRFEGRSSLRSWLYRIATNVCVDMHRGPQRRARPMDLSAAGTTDTFAGAKLPEHAWVSPINDERVLPADADPAEIAIAKDSIRLAFVAALQRLPARQRAVLILREVLRWPAAEVAQLLDTTVASVNSALQRARATLAEHDDGAPVRVVDDAQKELLARYVSAFERYDMSELVTLLRDDVVQSMPPYDFWITGPAEIVRWMTGPGIACAGSKLVPVSANGCAAFGQYKPHPQGGFRPWSLNVVELGGGTISALHFFLVDDPEYPETDLFPAFGLAPSLD